MRNIIVRLFILQVQIGACLAQTCDVYVGGYVPSYRNPAVQDFTRVSHAFYAFAKTNLSGDLLVDNVATTFNSFLTASAGKERFLSLAGGGGHESFAAMTESETAIGTFAGNCVAFCKANDLRGIDVDWEGITTVGDSIKYGKLMRALATALHDEDLLLVATIAYGSYGGDHYNVGALKKADWIQLMVYDQAGTWSESPYGNHASFQHMEDAIAYWTGRGYDDISKIVIGLPFYGYRFNSTAGGLATAVTYQEIVSANPHMACEQDNVGHTFFNGPETIRQKVEYVMENGLKGVMIWEMAQDLNSGHNKSLLRAISQAVCDLPPVCETVVSVRMEHTPSSQIYLKANPVRMVLEIALHELRDQVSKIILTDVSGKVVYKKEESAFEAVESISLSDQSAGVYFVRVSLLDGTPEVIRFIKI